MAYDFKKVEKKWQLKWEKEGTFNATNDYKKKKWYGLIEFPYPSGQGLHVGHPRSYTALDVIARKKRLQGYNVLYPIGFDAFGLPAENYAIKTNVHPKITTQKNIAHFTEQLKALGFSFDWSRVVDTTDPNYYKWTQWIFIQLYKRGLAYKATMPINFCTGCKVGLANEEVVNGVCERCGSPVVQKEKSQWMLKITEYAQRLIDDLDEVDFLDKIKVQQRNWIGRSEGAEVEFKIANTDETLQVFTTRPDTLFGATYMVIAPEHKLIEKFADRITNLDEVKDYQNKAALKSDFERSEINKDKTGVEIKGIKAINPLTNTEIPIWISDYVLSSYGTGAIMAVPAHDTRDFEFATKFNLPIIQVVKPADSTEVELPFTDVETGISINSGFLTGLSVEDAKRKVTEYLEENKIGAKKVNYKLRDWVFSRQRYWGEPIPMVHCDCCGWVSLDEKDLPLTLPEVEDFLPGENGESPLAKQTEWINTTCPKCGKPAKRETDTMPQWAGSSWYFLRYMDPHNDQALVSKDADEYWQNVDLYVGGSEHATGHLIYSRFWNKFLFDLGVSCKEEPFQKLINQGMIQGRSNFVYRIKDTNTFVTLEKKDQYDVTPIHVDVNIVSADVLDVEAFKAWRPEYNTAEFVLNDEGKYVCGWAVEKMSKSMFNVVNPDMIVEKFGADTLRLYEMFLGPVEQSKPWDTNGIDGCHRFLKKLWKFMTTEEGAINATDGAASKEELKALHTLIKKETADIEAFSYNTTIAAFMVCLNELTKLKSESREVKETLAILLAPFCPHVAEEFWHLLGHTTSVCDAPWPAFNEDYLKEDSVKMMVAFNGKARFPMEFPADVTKEEAEKAALENPQSAKWMEGFTVAKVIVVPGKMINVVLKK